MKVSEIFFSIQGEGPHAGVPTIFIRLQGCNLTCSYCDTDYAQSEVAGIDMSYSEVLDEVFRISHSLDFTPRICLTGGEPLLQNCFHLVKSLTSQSYNFAVDVETNGTYPVPVWYSMVSTWVVDYKLSSKNLVSNRIEEWIDLVSMDDLYIKFVIDQIDDLDNIYTIVDGLGIGMDFYNHVLISSVYGRSQEGLARIAKYCIKNGFRMNYQLHKLIWGDKRGV